MPKTTKKTETANNLTDRQLKEMYRRMVLIRRFEEVAFEKALAGNYANYHGAMGQEAIPVGACFDLTPEDGTMITHRGLGVPITRGVTVKDIFAGLYGRADSPTRGRIPVYHMGEPKLGVLTGTSMVGSVIPLASGKALANKLDKNNNVVISFFGDGAANRGDFHEGINLAGVWNLAIVFFCENNFYAKSMPLEKSTAGGSIIRRADGYGLPSMLVDGNDVLAVYDATKQAVARAREGGGPTFIECETYRWTPHSTAGDREFARTEEELASWKAKCPVRRLEALLLETGQASSEELNAFDEAAQREIEEAIDWVEKASDPGPEVALENVYV
jgi:pyruvate dehydrogenase E1 component alpha subunit